MRRPITIALLAAALALAVPPATFAAGLGRLTVHSALGQPLNAEIEIVSLQPGEEDGLAARLASTEAFAQAGIELNPAVLGIRFVIERRDGRPFLRLTSQQPVSEPFLDMLVELQWTTGRLVREYTFLLDPPEYRQRPQIAAVPSPTPKPAAPSAQPLPPMEAKPAPAPAPAAKPAPAPAAPARAPGKTHEVQKGDTLGAIARQNLPPGVTFNQMLIALYRANQDAFIRGNINLVRSGRILNIPDAEAIGTMDRAEANKLVSSHMQEFNEYRGRLAAVPTPAEGARGRQEASGRIESKPAAPPAPKQDQLRLSKADPKKPASPASKAAAADDAVARERALKEARSREADLEKNVADLQKLLALKNQQLAELEKKATAKPAPEPAKPAPAAPAPVAKAPEPAKPAPAPAPVAKAPEPAKPAAEAPKPAAPAAAPTPAPEAPKPAAEAPKPATDAPKPAAPAPADAAKKDAPKPAADAKKPEPAKPVPAKKKGPEPSILDQFLENPLALGGLGAVLLILAGYGFYAWRRKKAAHAKFQDSVLGAAAVGTGGPASLAEPTGAPAAGAVPGAAAPAAAAAAPAGMEAEEVDPIAEADVYMAYGRDAQAEEILKEALQKDEGRVAVHNKLLEIYAGRKDAKSFEQTALKLKGVTNGAGPDWDKAAALGRSIDPGNGLYAGSGAAPVAAAAAAGAAAPAIDFDLGGGGPSTGSAPDISLDEPAQEGSSPSTVDFDLGGGPAAAPAAQAKPDILGAETVIGTLPSKGESSASSIDFNLDLGGSDAPKAAPAPAAKAEPAGGGLDFDLNLDIGGGAPEKKAEPEKPMDLSSISLDLGGSGDETVVTGAQTSTDPKWQEVATKLDLAKAYEEMGDKDGAKELLNEVMKDGDAAQKGQAQQLLSKLG